MAKSKPAAPEKPKTIVIVSSKRTRKDIRAEYTQGEADFKLRENDNPLPSFGQAFDNLGPIVSSVCHFPKDYHETGLRVVAFKIGSKGGARTVVLHCAKDLDDSTKVFKFSTPERPLENATEEGAYGVPLSAKHAALVFEVIEEVRRYIVNDRAQGTIQFEEEPEDGDKDDDNDTAPFPDLTQPKK